MSILALPCQYDRDLVPGPSAKALLKEMAFLAGSAASRECGDAVEDAVTEVSKGRGLSSGGLRIWLRIRGSLKRDFLFFEFLCPKLL